MASSGLTSYDEVLTATNLTALGFVSTGDMGSGVWAFTIGLHTFATVVFGYRLSTPKFMTCVALLWVFVYGLAAASVPNHPDLYVRANAWCWVNPKYPRIRLWLHYFWIYFFEFGTVLVYSAMILAVRVRLQSNFYHTKEQAQRAKDAAKLMMAYPLTYVLCTLPLATMRMYSTGNSHRFIPPGWFCFAGAMITSNGWLDVLLYTLTRRVSLLSDEPPTTDNGIESFGTPWRRKAAFGTETFCEHVPDTPHGKPFPRTDSSDTELVYVPEQHHRQRKSTDIIGFVSITEKTTVEVTSEPMTRRERSTVRRLQQQGSSSVPGLDDRTPPCDHEVESECSTRQLWSGDNSSNGDDVGSKPSHRTSHTESHDVDNPPHLVKPAER